MHIYSDSSAGQLSVLDHRSVLFFHRERVEKENGTIAKCLAEASTKKKHILNKLSRSGLSFPCLPLLSDTISH